MEIRKYGDPVLREKARAVAEVTDEVRELIKDMAGTMYENKGIGLAAPQVGVKSRVIVVDGGQGLLALINPEILSSPEAGEELAEEGCLSLPEITVEVKRARKIRVKGLSEKGKNIETEAEGLLARAIQHEVDHLNGILMIDRISYARRQLLRSQLKKLEKAHA
ncbi:peptide deformylase [candidate division NPL-UPA2 bacterium]|nr:peptide deformylase [candidate division NPL-UPA2 bacterium]